MKLTRRDFLKTSAMGAAAVAAAGVLGACGSSSSSSSAPAETKAADNGDAMATTEAMDDMAETRENYLTFKIGTSYTEGSSFFEGVTEFKRLVEENTKGAVMVEIYGASALGSEGEMSEGVGMGTVDCCLIGSSSIAKHDSNFTVFSLPYLFVGNDHVDAVFAGAPGQAFRDSIWANSHVMILDYWDSGFRHYSNSKHEINSPADMQGLLIRVPDNKIQHATAEALGASTTTLSFNEVYLACSNGTIDGQEGPVFSFLEANLYEVQKYMVLDGHIYAVMGVLMNGAVWEKMTPEDQEIVMKAAYDAGIVEKNSIRSQEADQIEFLKEQGMTINETPDKAEWREVTASVYGQFEETFGADLITEIKDFPF